MKVISMKSRKNPARKRVIITIASTPHLPKPSSIMKLRIRSSPPRPRKVRPKACAPTRMMNTIDVSRTVVRMTPKIISMENFRVTITSSMAAVAPTAAASVGEARPTKIEPSTDTISTRGGTRERITRVNISAAEIDASSSAGMAGAIFGKK